MAAPFLKRPFFILASLVMGLDSVELLVRFEKYFEVNVPDAVSEKLYSPADVAAWISQHLEITKNTVSPSQELVAKQLQALFTVHAPVANTRLTDLLPTSEAWAQRARQLADHIGWQLPEIDWLQPPRARGWLNELFDWVTSVTPPEPNPYRFTDLVDWTLARNYELLLTKPWRNQYEVLQAVIGMTSDSSGLEVSSIKPDSHFTRDLGID
jgi:acyl carrier protein